MATLKIKLVLKGEGLQSARFVAEVVEYIEEQHFNNELGILAFALTQLPEIPSLARDAAFFRMVGLRGRTLRLARAERGSLIVELIALQAAYWILEKVCGEAFKDAWKETATHRKLKELFLIRLGRKEKLLAVQRAIQPESLRRIFDSQSDSYHYSRRMTNPRAASESLAVGTFVTDDTLTVEINDSEHIDTPPDDDVEIQGAGAK